MSMPNIQRAIEEYYRRNGEEEKAAAQHISIQEATKRDNYRNNPILGLSWQIRATQVGGSGLSPQQSVASSPSSSSSGSSAGLRFTSELPNSERSQAIRTTASQTLGLPPRHPIGSELLAPDTQNHQRTLSSSSVSPDSTPSAVLSPDLRSPPYVRKSSSMQSLPRSQSGGVLSPSSSPSAKEGGIPVYRHEPPLPPADY